jgi:hypothetical protein
VGKNPARRGVAVDYARTLPGITRVILLGHSGGSPLMSFYQAVAENGVGYCQGPNKIVPCGNDLAGMTPADGLLFAEAHPGDGAQALRGINPSLSIVDGKLRVDPALDPFNPKNGFNPEGASHYPPEFRTKYYAAQSNVMNDQLAQVLAKQEPWGEASIPTTTSSRCCSAIRKARRVGPRDPSIPEFMSTARAEIAEE